MDKKKFWEKFTELANFVRKDNSERNYQSVQRSKFLIISLLQEGPMTTQQLFCKSGLGVSTIQIRLKNLMEENIVGKMNDGNYYLKCQNKD